MDADADAEPDAEDDAEADAVERVRRLCLALPGATERLSHGSPGFFVGRQFLTVDDHHHGAPHLAFWCAAPPGAQEEMVAEDPARYFRPPYVGHRGWLGVRLAGEGVPPPDWDEVAAIVREAHRTVAPPRLIAREAL